MLSVKPIRYECKGCKRIVKLIHCEKGLCLCEVCEPRREKMDRRPH